MTRGTRTRVLIVVVVAVVFAGLTAADAFPKKCGPCCIGNPIYCQILWVCCP